jgi:hypothetical protein
MTERTDGPHDPPSGPGVRGAPDPDPRPSPVLPVVLTLPGGRTLQIRLVTPTDAPALERLYDELSSRDRYRRFFSGSRPSNDVIEGWTRASEHGGMRIVTVDEKGAIVADAGYALLSDGDAEFDITVAQPFRGWLGPYLLDLLLDLAAGQGIPNLEAEVLIDNRCMLEMLRRRGFAVIDHDDHSTLRVVIGATASAPSWPPGRHRPRVLVETRRGRWRGEAAARAAGLDVIVCRGPDEGTRRHCPALEGRGCPLAEAADAIVMALPDETDLALHEVSEAHRSLHRKPVLFADPAGDQDHAQPPAEYRVLPEDDTAVRVIMEALGLDTSLPKRKPG